MPDAGLTESQQIARDIVVAALVPGGNQAASLPALIGVEKGTKFGEFLGDAYAAALRKVREANRENPG